MRRARREDLENQLNKGALWAVTYGDLMSYLMIFFLILFSFHVSKDAGRTTTEKLRYTESLMAIQKVFGGNGSSADYERLVQRQREESMVTQLKQAIDDKKLSQYAQVEAWDKKVRLVLSDSVMFDSGSSQLEDRAKPILSAVAEQLKTLK